MRYKSTKNRCEPSVLSLAINEVGLPKNLNTYATTNAITKTAVFLMIPKNIALAYFIYLFFKTLTIMALKQ